MKKYGYETIIGGTIRAENIDRARELVVKALRSVKLINWTEIREIEPKSSSKKEYY